MKKITQLLTLHFLSQTMFNTTNIFRQTGKQANNWSQALRNFTLLSIIRFIKTFDSIQPASNLPLHSNHHYFRLHKFLLANHFCTRNSNHHFRTSYGKYRCFYMEALCRSKVPYNFYRSIRFYTRKYNRKNRWYQRKVRRFHKDCRFRCCCI